MNFTATWGDPYYLGLTGLEVIGHDGEALPVTLDMVDADPRDLHVLPGYEQDDRTLDKLVSPQCISLGCDSTCWTHVFSLRLIDGQNITMSDEHMWLIPFTAGEDHWLSIDFPHPTEMVGLRFWNYNKSAEDTYRGVIILPNLFSPHWSCDFLQNFVYCRPKLFMFCWMAARCLHQRDISSARDLVHATLTLLRTSHSQNP